VSARPDFIILADMLNSSPANSGNGTGTVPVIGDEIRVPNADASGAPMILTVYRRVLDCATATWHVHVNRSA
jgi:hypothetical protein